MFGVKGDVHYEAKYTIRYDSKQKDMKTMEKIEDYEFQARKLEQAIDAAKKYIETLRKKYAGKGWCLDIHLDSLLKIEDITPKK
jgi:predicted RNase H-like nuclease (RuvC/YqgF family)